MSVNSLALASARDMAEQVQKYLRLHRIEDATEVLHSLISYLDYLYQEQARIERIHAETSRVIQRALESSKKKQH